MGGYVKGRAMDYAACNIVYVDRRAGEDMCIKREAVLQESSTANGQELARGYTPVGDEIPHADRNVQTLLGIFSEVHVCTSGGACVSKLTELSEASSDEMIPTLVLVDIPYEDHAEESQAHANRTPSPMSQRINNTSPEDVDHAFYGLSLLRCISLDIQQHNLSKLVVPVAVVTIPGQGHSEVKALERTQEKVEQGSAWTPFPRRIRAGSVSIPLDQKRTMKYLDVGAVDVLTSPLLKERLPSLAIHAYRAHKESLKEHNAFLEVKRGRKRSWVGLDDQKPYAYLREAMVSGLMDGICRLGGEELPISHVRISVPVDRCEKIENAIGSWYFSAHDFTDDELLHAAMLMLQHALAMPELDHWRLSAENLMDFLVACRAAYNAFVPYHNFRHVIDVLQAVFVFLVELDTLPAYPAKITSPKPEKSPIAALLRPFDALTLLITAIGHDVGHPGVNNAFLVTLNAPLAQLYNDRSVLESFHCAAYSQILRRHWPAAFSGVEMRQLMISSILATDMGLHFDYMKKLGFLQEKLDENGGTDGFNGRLLEEYRALACALLIKCADISNVARRYDVAAQWTDILTTEFARQASMEADLGIPSALFATPTRETVELGKSQLNFMNMFAIPLFQGITDIMPAMQFTVDELHKNINIWTGRIEEAQQKKESDDSQMDGMFSPRAMSLAFPSDAGNPQGSDRSGSMSSKLSELLSSGAHGSSKKKTATLEGITESDFQDTWSKGPSKGPDDEVIAEPNGAIEGEPLIPPVYSMARRSSKPTPSQLQLSYATVSAPGLVDHPSQDAHAHNLQKSNGIHVGRSLVTDAVVRDEQTPTPRPDSKHRNAQRTSDTTDSNNSAPGSHDWASQATSATTSKIPLSPSTRGTSIMSSESTERPTTVSPLTRPPSNPSPTRTSTTASQSCPTLPATSEHTEATTATDPGLSETKNGSGVTIIETMRSLARKSSRSRFRMNFWKKKSGPAPGGGFPPMPATLSAGTEDEARGRSRGGEERRGQSRGNESRGNETAS